MKNQLIYRAINKDRLSAFNFTEFSGDTNITCHMQTFQKLWIILGSQDLTTKNTIFVSAFIVCVRFVTIALKGKKNHVRKKIEIDKIFQMI